MTANPSLPIRVGVVGLGLIAQAVHLQNLRELHALFKVTHLCDLSAHLAARLADEWGGRCATGVRVSTDCEAVFSDPAVDAVLLLTPGTHTTLTHRALQAGKHVLAEKPFSHTTREALALHELARTKGRVLQVGYMKLYDPIMQRARAELDTIGALRLVQVTVLHPADGPQFAHQRYLQYGDADLSQVMKARCDETAQLQEAIGDVGEPWCSLYRDVLQGSVVHEMAVLRGLFSNPALDVRYAQIGATVNGQVLTEPPQLQVLGGVDQMQIALSWNWLPDFPDYTETVTVFGSAGQLRLRFPGPYLRDHRTELTVERQAGTERSTCRLLSDHRTGFVHELLAFHEAISFDRPTLSTAEGSAWDTAALQEIIAALATRNGANIGGEARTRLVESR